MLLGSTILEIALGLGLIYLLLAVICSTLNEWIAGILKLRARTLQEGIANLLEDPEVKGLAQDFFAHPLVKGLTRQGKSNLPSYIPAPTFTAALLDIILPNDPNAGPQDLLQVYEQVRAQLIGFSGANSQLAKTMLLLLDQAGVDPQKMQEAAAALRQLELVRTRLLELAQRMEAGDVQNLQPLAASLEKFKELEAALQQTEMNARTALLRAQENVERYFDQSMDRVSGWYKRRAQLIITGLAVVVTTLLNVDSFTFTNYLVKNDAARSSVVAMAENYYRQQPGSEQGAAVVVAATNATQTTTGKPAGVGSSVALSASAPVTVSTPLSLSASVSETLAVLDQLNLPIGWQAMPASFGAWLYKIVGLLITAIAVSFGAPFWFDLLGRLVNLRMAGKKPPEAPATNRAELGSTLDARLRLQPISKPVELVSRPPLPPTLAELARRALLYVAELKKNRPLTVPERDIAVAWLLMETTKQQVAATPDEIVQAVAQAGGGA